MEETSWVMIHISACVKLLKMNTKGLSVFNLKIMTLKEIFFQCHHCTTNETWTRGIAVQPHEFITNFSKGLPGVLSNHSIIPQKQSPRILVIDPINQLFGYQH